jgi:S1 RNA binding domain protein
MSEEEAQLSEETAATEETPVEAAPTEAPAAEETSEAVSAEAPADEAVPEGAPTEEAADEVDEEVPDGPPVSEVVEVGAIVQGTVQRTTPYGAFIQLPGGKLGLIHISEIDRNYVKDVTEHVREGDSVKAKVLAIKEDGKIDLSIKALQDPAPRVQRRGSDPGFEQMLRKFMRQSEERQVDVKRSVMNKRK